MTSDRSTFQRRSPKQARSRATWDAILEAAAQILERHGPDGLTTNDVAERAGVSIGSLYQYFPDKEAILVAAARRELSGAPLAARQTALVQALIAMIERLSGGGRATAKVALTRAETTRAPKSRRPTSWERRCGELLEQLIEALAPAQPALSPIPVRMGRS
jgi:AcrR family transcriptional regulator